MTEKFPLHFSYIIVYLKLSFLTTSDISGIIISRKRLNKMTEVKNQLEEESDVDLYYASRESASETEDVKSTTLEDEDEIDLVNIASKDLKSRKCIQFLIWSSVLSDTSNYIPVPSLCNYGFWTNSIYQTCSFC